jgi:hypothetical protein
MQFMLPEHVLILAALVLVLVLLGLTAGDDRACQFRYNNEQTSCHLTVMES